MKDIDVKELKKIKYGLNRKVNQKILDIKQKLWDFSGEEDKEKKVKLVEIIENGLEELIKIYKENENELRLGILNESELSVGNSLSERLERIIEIDMFEIEHSNEGELRGLSSEEDIEMDNDEDVELEDRGCNCSYCVNSLEEDVAVTERNTTRNEQFMTYTYTWNRSDNE